MTRRPAARNCDHPQYPQYREEFGEDLARTLYHLDPGPRIRGIDDRELLRAYLHVETERPAPRTDVVGQINRRLDALDELSAANGTPTKAAVAVHERRSYAPEATL